MTYYFARNLTWGELSADNTVSASFDIFNENDEQIGTTQTVEGSVMNMQQLIEQKVRTTSEAVALFETIRENSELAIEMTS